MKSLILCTVIGAGLLCTACFGLGDASPESNDNSLPCVNQDATVDPNCLDQESFGYFLRDVDKMQSMGLPTYWLGRKFQAGGLTLQGPYGLENDGEPEDDKIEMRYNAWLEETPFQGRTVGFSLLIYGPRTWDTVKQRYLNPSSPPPGNLKPSKKTVTVQGHDAQLWTLPAVNRPVNAVALVVQLDPVTIVVEAPSLLSPADGTEGNIFVKNPDLLVQVMQNLRPYPQ